jgi:hypothetical protein
MKFYQEITEWSYDVPNHIYYLNEDKSKMVGYIKKGTTELFKFTKPISFSVRGRKFILLDRKGESDSVYFPSAKKTSNQQTDSITVDGSNGKTYTVSKVAGNYVCSCPGYQFRRKCKHVLTMGLK